jgi:hypothetical protein
MQSCPKNIATKFSAEHWFQEYHNAVNPKAIKGFSRDAAPLAVHKMWRFFPKPVVKNWLIKFPLLRELMQLQHVKGTPHVPIEKYIGVSQIVRNPSNPIQATPNNTHSTTARRRHLLVRGLAQKQKRELGFVN